MKLWALLSGLVLTLQISAEVKALKCEVLEEITRAKKGFTQGFFILDGKLYESTGGYGSSLIRRYDLKTQNIELSKRLPKHLFGEGLTPFLSNKMIQLTWKKGLGIIYDREAINIIKTFRYPTEGWGITTQGNKILMSDGTSKLYYLDPETFQQGKTIKVTKDGVPIENINELEWVEGFIYANIWMSDEIVKIDPNTGNVVATIDCSKLHKNRSVDKQAVLNGIAYDFDEKVFYLTGKRWPTMYKVRFLEP